MSFLRIAFCSRLEKNQSACLDTFSCRRIGRARRIVERGMRREARAAVIRRVITFEQDRLVAPHLRKIEPSMIWVKGDGINLAGAVAISEVARDPIALVDSAGIA